MSGFVLDTREFDAALIQYAAASKKDFKDISNKRILSVAFRSMPFIKNADKKAINLLKKEKDLLWWFAWRKYIPRGMSKYDAYEKALFLVTQRSKAVGFLKAFFLGMARAIAPYVEGASMRSSSGKGMFMGFKALVFPATTERPLAQVAIVYDYKVRSERTAKRAEKILYDALQKGFRADAADMMKYVNGKMGLTAKKYSARAA